MQSTDSASNRTLLWMAWVFLLVGSLGSFGLYGAKVVAGSPSDALKPSVWGKVVGSHTASVLLLRVVMVIVLGGLLLSFARRATDIWRGAALVLAVGLVMTYSSIGHPYAEDPVPLWVGIDALHLAAISLWVGGLLMFAFGSSTWLTDPDAERIVRRFSVTAMVAVPVIVGTGVAQTLKLAGSLDDVTSTSWGRALLVKVAVVTVLVAIGGVTQWLLRHDGPAAIRRNVLVEALIGIGVVGVAAALVALPPQSVAASKVFTTTLTSGGVIADVTVTPGRVGENEVHLVITPPGGGITPVVSTTVGAELPAAGTGLVRRSSSPSDEPLHGHDRADTGRRLERADHCRAHAGPIRGVERADADPGRSGHASVAVASMISRKSGGTGVAVCSRLAATRLPRLFWSVMARTTTGPRRPPTGIRPAATAAIRALDTCAAMGCTFAQSTWSASDRIVRATSFVRSAVAART